MGFLDAQGPGKAVWVRESEAVLSWELEFGLMLGELMEDRSLAMRQKCYSRSQAPISTCLPPTEARPGYS